MLCDRCATKHTCSEYQANGISDKSYYDWIRKENKCSENLDEFHARANRLAEPV